MNCNCDHWGLNIIVIVYVIDIVYVTGSRQLIGVKSSFTYTGSFAFFGLDPDTHYEVIFYIFFFIYILPFALVWIPLNCWQSWKAQFQLNSQRKLGTETSILF